MDRASLARSLIDAMGYGAGERSALVFNGFLSTGAIGAMGVRFNRVICELRNIMI